MCKPIIYYYETEYPKKVRIKSEKLCLDHTFETDATDADNSVRYEDLIKMCNDGIYDDIRFVPTKQSCFMKAIVPEEFENPNWLYLDEIWYKFSDFEFRKATIFENPTTPINEKGE